MLPGTKQIGDFQRVAVARLSHSDSTLLPFHAENADHAARRGVGRVLHRATAFLHDAQSRLEIHYAGKYQRRVLTEAQAGRGCAACRPIRVRSASTVPGPPDLPRTVLAGCEPSSPTRPRDLGAELIQIVTEHGRRPIEQRACRRHFRTNRRAHADRLGALTGKEEGDFGRVGSHASCALYEKWKRQGDKEKGRQGDSSSNVLLVSLSPGLLVLRTLSSVSTIVRPA